jgi:EmrB/QacA subfamily drug resistance transporter
MDRARVLFVPPGGGTNGRLAIAPIIFSTMIGSAMSQERAETGTVTSQATTEGVNPRRWKILAVLVVSLLVVVLDSTILNVALKTIQEDLGATQNEVVWAVNAYTLAFAALLFTWGVLGDRYGRKRILVIGLIMFGAASALCAFAQTPTQLILFRTLMGIGGASVMPVTLSMITVIFPPQERGKAIGMWAASVGGAVALGPVLGGLLLEHPNWFHWLTGNDWGSVFFINVPIVIAGVIGILAIVPESKNPNAAHLDPQGLLLSVAGLFGVVYGIQNSGSDGWASPQTWGPLVAGALILAGFVFVEFRSAHPSLDLSLFRIRSFSVPLTSISLAFAAMQGTMLFLAFYYQIVRAWTPLQSGLLVLPFAIGQFLGAPRSAGMVQRFGARAVISGGLALAALGMLGVAVIQQDSPVWYLIIVGLTFGYGLGNAMAPATTRMTLATPPARSGAGSAVQNTVRQVAAALGVAVMSSIISLVYVNRITPVINASPLPDSLKSTASGSIGATNGVADALAASGKVPAAAVQRLRQAGFDAFMPSLHWAAGLSVALMVVAVLLILWRLPAKAEAVAWTGSHETDTDAVDAAHSVHVVSEESGDLAHVADAPLERPESDGTELEGAYRSTS